MSKKKALPPGVRERKGRFTFRYSVTVTDPATKKKRRKQKETPSFDTPEEAANAGILIKAKKLKGNLIDEKKVTISARAKTFLEDYELEREVKKNTLRVRTYALNVLMVHFGSDELVRNVDPGSYQEMLNKLKRDGKSKSTLTLVHSGCSIFFKDCVRKQIITADPTETALVPAFRKTAKSRKKDPRAKLPQYLEKEELKAFLEVARFQSKLYQWYVAFLLMAYTGMRIGELTALQWSDFNRKKKTLSITKSLYAPNSLRDYEVTPPKNDTSERVIGIGDVAVKALIELEKQQQAVRLEAGDRYHNDTVTIEWTGETFKANFIFTSIDHPGYPCCEEYLRKQMKRILGLAGLPLSLSPHSLRHTHVSILAENPKVQLADIQQRLGHKSGSEITERIYLHVTKKRQEEMPDHFEWAMRG